jgi:hypothetical protein
MLCCSSTIVAKAVFFPPSELLFHLHQATWKDLQSFFGFFGGCTVV